MRPSSIVVLACLSQGCVATTVPPGMSVVLRPEQNAIILEPCSRPGPGEGAGGWLVPEDIAARLDLDLPKLRKLTSSTCCFLGGRVDDPGIYFRQYFGVIIGGRKLVYVNGVGRRGADGSWRTSAFSVCDGGSEFWGVLYDPETRTFSDLAFNGSA